MGMGDHFWPSIYPAMAVGLLYGFAIGGVRNAVLGTIGALIASYLGFIFLGSVLAEEGLLPLAALLGISLGGAVAVTKGARMILGSGKAASG